ncbi:MULTISPECIES: hypothetical protein [unclassified Mesorhizobium]|uniref:hypothetical protein n=1 Tax=unclassified Mesorhizobium TaxID=325217 RepID=UPI0015E27F73|nr:MULTISPECIES: hypothetical protein [unclassified Mesorhizobium]
MNAVAPDPVQDAAPGQDTPLGRAGQPSEVGWMCLPSNDLSFAHGSVFDANGGTGVI